ncbi:methyltransferase [Marivivens niveibacter]|uniref:Methyltransferase n=1 Tax=Marivivens niveibacter TaxID=1930667 RepID=A0A251X166_9RHOB|nr:SAM-dependent methyltransferase [Marivivens niveibacter]OUD10336.1 methyltransferase [Marivivens niveibacter]
MTALTDILKRRIATTGPITIADYMTEALLHPEHGYYTTRDPLGAAGDFVTAPEISQMFGEMIGLCLAQAWIDQGRPKGVLAELGPGRGTLMHDVLRATKAVPGFHDALDLHLVEASPVLAEAQAARLPVVQSHARAADLPDAPLFLIANEFFDALPIRQFIRDGNSWRERMVGLTDGALAFGLSSPAPLAMLEHRLDDTKDGDLVEICPSAAPITQDIGNRIAQHGGAAIIIDYGDWRSLGDTFQALKDHETIDPLTAPGSADLTAHVDFETIAAACSPARHTRLSTQGVFLERLGITARAQALAQTMSGDKLQSHIAAHRRLTHPAEMGDLFKVIGILPNNAPAIAGLEL